MGNNINNKQINQAKGNLIFRIKKGDLKGKIMKNIKPKIKKRRFFSLLWFKFIKFKEQRLRTKIQKIYSNFFNKKS